MKFIKVEEKRKQLYLSDRVGFLFFYYVGNIVINLHRRYDGITRKSTAENPIAEGDFLIVLLV